MTRSENGNAGTMVAGAPSADGLGKTEKVIDHLLRMMDGRMAPHDRLPTERELATDLQVSRLTVRRAIGELEADGRLYRVQGAGTFVAAKNITKNLELTSFSEDMRMRGWEPGSGHVSIERRAAGASLGYRLHIPPSEPVMHIHRIRTADGIPMCLEDAYFRASLFPEEVALGRDSSLYELLEGQGVDSKPHWANQRIQATVLSESDAMSLGVPPFSPALVAERVVFNLRDEPIEVARSTYRADRYDYEVTIQRVSRVGLLEQATGKPTST